MTKLYKLTDADWTTYNSTLWGPNVTHTVTGECTLLCRSSFIHVYEGPLTAIFMNPIHGNFKSPVLWSASGEIAMRDGPLKCGCKALTTIEEMALPEISIVARIRTAITLAQRISTDTAWREWATRWLSKEDRTTTAAEKAAELVLTVHRIQPVSKTVWASAIASDATIAAAQEAAQETEAFAAVTQVATAWIAARVARVVRRTAREFLWAADDLETVIADAIAEEDKQNE